MWIVILSMWLFDGCSVEKAKNKAQRVLYFRRMSSYSFSCFVFGFTLSQFIRNVICFDAKIKLQIFQIYGYAVVYFTFTLLVHCWLDQFGGNFTPDYMIKRFAFVFSNKKEFKSIASQHLEFNVDNVLGPLE